MQTQSYYLDDEHIAAIKAVAKDHGDTTASAALRYIVGQFVRMEAALIEIEWIYWNGQRQNWGWRGIAQEQASEARLALGKTATELADVRAAAQPQRPAPQAPPEQEESNANR